MKHYWKIVLILCALLFLAGIVIGGAGYLTGASPNRIAEVLYGGWDGLRSAVESLLAQVSRLF